MRKYLYELAEAAKGAAATAVEVTEAATATATEATKAVITTATEIAISAADCVKNSAETVITTAPGIETATAAAYSATARERKPSAHPSTTSRTPRYIGFREKRYNPTRTRCRGDDHGASVPRPAT